MILTFLGKLLMYCVVTFGLCIVLGVLIGVYLGVYTVGVVLRTYKQAAETIKRIRLSTFAHRN